MYAEIKAKSENDNGPLSRNGKTTWVNEESPTMEIATTSPKHIGFPPWHIEIKAENCFWSDSYVGESITTTRKVAIDLTPSDISALFDLALPLWLQETNIHKRKKLAFDLLRALDDAELLSFLSELLPSRPCAKV